jgi:hypothetical protein
MMAATELAGKGAVVELVKVSSMVFSWAMSCSAPSAACLRQLRAVCLALSLCAGMPVCACVCGRVYACAS